jgi:hypothetical protein
MVVVSYSGKEINAKLVYYGPGLSGKTTNLEYIYQSVPSTNRGKMVSMKTRTERTLFFDFLPIDLGDIGGFKTRFLLYTVPGQVYYNATRKLVLRGVDAVIFVADSGRGKMEENIESLQNLRENLREYGLSPDEMPWVIQYNKRDLPDAYTVEELEAALNPGGAPYFEAVATTGQGVFECFRGIARLLLNKLSQEIKLGAGTRTAPSRAPAPVANPAAPAATTSEEPASSTPPPGLMSGGPLQKAYRPPVPKNATESTSPASRPPSAPNPSRPPAPFSVGQRPVAGPIRTPEAAPPSRPAYRPSVPGAPSPVLAAHGETAALPTPPARPPVPRSPERTEFQPSAQDSAPAPLATGGVAGADWFEEQVTQETSSRSSPGPAKEAPGGPETSFEMPRPVEKSPFQESWDAPADFTMPANAPAMPPSGIERVEALSRRLEEDSDLKHFNPSQETEENPGFWSRIFRRRKDHQEYRRYPSRLDMPAPDSPQTRPSFAEEPMSGPVTSAPEPASLDAEPEPRAPEPEIRTRSLVTLKLARGADRRDDFEADVPPAYAEDPVLLERTLLVPITLGPEAVRRGACLRLTLEVVVEVSEETDGLPSLEDTQAA